MSRVVSCEGCERATIVIDSGDDGRFDTLRVEWSYDGETFEPVPGMQLTENRRIGRGMRVGWMPMMGRKFLKTDLLGRRGSDVNVYVIPNRHPLDARPEGA